MAELCQTVSLPHPDRLLEVRFESIGGSELTPRGGSSRPRHTNNARFPRIVNDRAVLPDPQHDEPVRTLARHRQWDHKTFFGIRIIPVGTGTIRVGDGVSAT